jgi:hypothetical protein
MSYKSSTYDIDQQILEGGGGGGTAVSADTIALNAQAIPAESAGGQLDGEIMIGPFASTKDGFARVSICGIQAAPPGANVAIVTSVWDVSNQGAAIVPITDMNPSNINASRNLNVSWVIPVANGGSYSIQYFSNVAAATSVTGVATFEIL